MSKKRKHNGIYEYDNKNTPEGQKEFSASGEKRKKHKESPQKKSFRKDIYQKHTQGDIRAYLSIQTQQPLPQDRVSQLKGATRYREGKRAEKKIEKTSKKVLTKGDGRGIIVERSRETATKAKSDRKNLKKISKKDLTNDHRCDRIVKRSREKRTGP